MGNQMPLSRPIEEIPDRRERVPRFAWRANQLIEHLSDILRAYLLYGPTRKPRQPVSVHKSLGLPCRASLVADGAMQLQEVCNGFSKVRRRREVRILVFQDQLRQPLPGHLPV